PGDGAFEEKYRLVPCADRYRLLNHRPTDTRPNKVFEHVVAQLLFEGRYEPSAGYCREFHVHFGAPPDACARLVAHPESFLAQAGALDDVRATLSRYRVAKELAQLDARAAKPPLEPAVFASFHCYVEGGAPKRANTPFSLDGYRFSA